MANTFPVAESPLDFTRVIAPYVRHCHVKDYRAVIEPDGFRLVRCPSGDGCVPHKEMFDILAEHNDEMIACIEIGALEDRHVKLYTPEWWHGYAAQAGRGARRLPPRRAEEPLRAGRGMAHAVAAQCRPRTD